MNRDMIQIEVTYASGTVTKISIPWEEKAVTAVSYHTEQQTGVETPAKTQEELDAEYCRYHKMEQTEMLPTGTRYKSVSEMVESTREKEEVEGKGRIGGVGERKERGVEEEKPEHQDLLLLAFDTQTTPYTLTQETLRDFIAAYGIDLVRRELPIAKAWLTANQKKRKTYKGTERYLNAWLSRRTHSSLYRFEHQPAPKPAQRGSLLQASNDSQEGW